MIAVTTVTVAAGDDGARLDRWFKRHYPGLGLGRLQKLLRTGQIRVDGGRVKSGHRVSEGQTIRIPPLGDLERLSRTVKRTKVSKEDQRAVESMILHEDDRVLVVNKPPGLAVQGGSGMTKHLDAMLNGLRGGKPDKPRLVHRLDKDTSGILVLARDAAGARFLGKAFKSRDVRKLYWAVTVGCPSPEAGIIDLPLLKIGRKGVEKVQPHAEMGRKAISVYRVLDRAGRRASWLAMEPLTGRTHQLRVHAMEALGCSILGDGKYGGRNAHLDGGGISRKLHLHARALRAPHPDGGEFAVRATLPDHFDQTMNFFGFDVNDRDADLFLDSKAPAWF